jgi:hypothetical protein
MDWNVETSSSSTTPANPDVNPTVSKLLKGLQGAYGQGVKVFDKSLYPGVSSTTQGAWGDTLNAANNPQFMGNVQSAMGEFGDIAAGRRFGENAPGFAALRSGIMDDVMTETNKTFDSAGLFGSDSNREAAGRGLGEALAGLDYGNYENDIARQERAIGNLGNLFSMNLMPGAAKAGVGSAMDADMLAQRGGENDLFRRTNDAPWDALARSSSILSGTAGAAGSNTSQQIPWWAALGGGLAGAAGLFF